MLHLLIFSLFINCFVFETNSKPAGVAYTLENDGSGHSHFRYEAEDGTIREETVRIVNKDTENEYPVISGFYSYFGPDGKKYQVDFVADDKGFKILKPVAVDDAQISIIPIVSTAAVATLQGGGFG